MSQAPTNPAEPPTPRSREISGSVVVIGMLLLGITAVATLFVYFEFHTRPFRPLREAIGREFRHSRPNVEGGRPRGRGPMILRISMSVPFDPFQDETRCTEITARVLKIARQYQELPRYDQVHLNLIHFAPEKEAKRRTFEWTGPDASQDPPPPPRAQPFREPQSRLEGPRQAGNDIDQ